MCRRRLFCAGAGGGLGRVYALAFAAAGAKVLVNDVSAAPPSGGALPPLSLSRVLCVCLCRWNDSVAKAGVRCLRAGPRAAEAVVAEIRSLGGEAAPDFHDVCEGKAIIDAAVKAFGRVDVLVNNAGILRDVSFAKMTLEEMESVLRVSRPASRSARVLLRCLLGLESLLWVSFTLCPLSVGTPARGLRLHEGGVALDDASKVWQNSQHHFCLGPLRKLRPSPWAETSAGLV